MKTKLTALKDMRYNTRRLLAGDIFEARPSDARILIALGKAKGDRDLKVLPSVPEDLARKIAKQSSSNETLLGSSTLESTYVIGDETVQLGTIVANAYKDSGLSLDDWNNLSDGDRDVKLNAELERLKAGVVTPENSAGPTGPSGNAAPASTVVPTDPTTQTPPVDENKGDTQPPKDDDKEDIQKVRDEYLAVVGRRAYAGWDIPTLRTKIDEFKAANK